MSRKKNKQKAKEFQAPTPVPAQPLPPPETTEAAPAQAAEPESAPPPPEEEKKELPPDPLEDPKPPVDPEKIPPTIKKNVDSRKAAKDVLAFIQDEYNGVSNTFWEVLRDFSLEKAGFPVDHPKGTKPLDDESKKDLMEAIFPKGKYMGKKVKEVLKKDRAYLLLYMNEPNPLQKKLRRFFSRPDQQPKAVKK